MGEGEGFTINIPLYVDCRDLEYVGILDKVLRPIALDFRPEMILVSAGFDSYVNDPVGGTGVFERPASGLMKNIPSRPTPLIRKESKPG